jgi:hypothetical protein
MSVDLEGKIKAHGVWRRQACEDNSYCESEIIWNSLVINIKIKFQESEIKKKRKVLVKTFDFFFKENYGWVKLLTVNYSLHQSGTPMDLCHGHNFVHCQFLREKNSRNFSG